MGAIIIGDEIMRGKRQDGHFRHVIETLARRGLTLAWCELLGDDPYRITTTFSRTLKGDDLVFCFGGIGATPDDHTRACAAAAAGVPLVRHPEALAEIEAHFGAEAYPTRVLMADLPAGSGIIPNPYNRIPGFSVQHHHFLPGFPLMAWPMMDWVLDTRYPALHAPADAEEALIVMDVVESMLMDVMTEAVSRFPAARLFSLPHLGDGERWIELGVRGEASAVAEAIAFLKDAIQSRGYACRLATKPA